MDYILSATGFEGLAPNQPTATIKAIQLIYILAPIIFGIIEEIWPRSVL